MRRALFKRSAPENFPGQDWAHRLPGFYIRVAGRPTRHFLDDKHNGALYVCGIKSRVYASCSPCNTYQSISITNITAGSSIILTKTCQLPRYSAACERKWTLAGDSIVAPDAILLKWAWRNVAEAVEGKKACGMLILVQASASSHKRLRKAIRTFETCRCVSALK